MTAEKRVRWGLLSTARINERLIPAFRASVRSEVVAVASRSQSAARHYATEWGIERAYGSYDEMLADPDVDAVYVSVPNSLHADWSVRSADAGKHVLCEKPMAIIPEDVDRMADAAGRNGVVVQEACMMRFHSQTHRVRDMIAQGAIGDLRTLRGLFTIALEGYGDIRFDPQLGGGVLWDLGSYPVSFMQTMMRGNPVEVQGMQELGESGVDVSFAGQMRFAGGALAQFYCSNRAMPQTKAQLVGTEGMIQLDLPWVNHIGVRATARVILSPDVQPISTFSDVGGQLATETLVSENVNAYQDEVDAMAAAILDGAEPVIPLTDSSDNVRTIVALYRSAREGGPVSL